MKYTYPIWNDLWYIGVCCEVTTVDVGHFCSLLFLVVFAHSVFFLSDLVTLLRHVLYFEHVFMGINSINYHCFLQIGRCSQTKVALCSELSSLDSPAVGLVTVAIMLALANTFKKLTPRPQFLETQNGNTFPGTIFVLFCQAPGNAASLVAPIPRWSAWRQVTGNWVSGLSESWLISRDFYLEDDAAPWEEAQLGVVIFVWTSSPWASLELWILFPSFLLISQSTV